MMSARRAKGAAALAALGLALAGCGGSGSSLARCASSLRFHRSVNVNRTIAHWRGGQPRPVRLSYAR